MTARRKRIVVLCTIVFVAFVANPDVSAQVIDFETDGSGGTPNVGDAISTQFQANHGVSFSLDPPGFPMFGDYQNDPEGWTCDLLGLFDYLDPNQQTYAGGDWFLYYPDARNNTLVVTYTTFVQAFSFSIHDIDGQEEFFVTVKTTNGGITLIVSPLTSHTFKPMGDCLATYVYWQTTPALGPIEELRIDAASNKGIGFAMDNFDPSDYIIPKRVIPSTTRSGTIVLVVFVLLAGLIYVLRRRRIATL